MKRTLFIVFWITGAAFGQSTTCASFTNTTNQPQLVLFDTAEHNSGGHGVATGFYNFPAWPSGGDPTSTAVQGKCTYKSGNGSNCDTTCSVNLVGGTTTSEQGTLSAAGTHMVNFGVGNGSSAGQSAGASCALNWAGAAANCLTVPFTQTCFVSLSFTGSGFTLNTNGHAVWSASNQSSLTCAAQADPAKQTAGPPPDPCAIDPSSPDCCAVNPDPKFCSPLVSSESPIIIDTEGEGFHLTSAANGVLFDIRGNSHPMQLGWTDPHFRNAFLALPGADGLVHNGKQLFGNFTPQPVSPHPNGFLALAEFDKPENGGNGDGVIDERDSVFSSLRLWIDENHDGISQPNELHTLRELSVYSLSLRYFESRKEDQFGNQFRYKARVNPDRAHRDPRDATQSGEPARWTYDVFLTLH